MEQALTLDHFEGVLKFLRAHASFSPLISVSEKLKNKHSAFSRTRVFVDDLENIRSVVIEDGESIRSDPDHVRLLIYMNEGENQKAICQLISHSFPLKRTMLTCCNQTVIDSMARSLKGRFSTVASTDAYALPKGAVFNPICPKGYGFRRATEADVSFFHSTWKFASSPLSPYLKERYSNMIRRLPSVMVIYKDEGKDIVVGCGIQDILGCIGKVYVDEAHRRCGLASFIISELCSQIQSVGDVVPPHAYVEKDNHASSAVFEKLGFEKQTDTFVWGWFSVA